MGLQTAASQADQPNRPATHAASRRSAGVRPTAAPGPLRVDARRARAPVRHTRRVAARRLPPASRRWPLAPAAASLMSTLMSTAAASSDTSARASPGSIPRSPTIARADKDEPGACPICTCVSRPIMHTTARHHGLVQCSAGLRGCIPGGSSTFSDSLQAGRAHRSREAFEAWHLHTWAAHEAAWAGWSTHVATGLFSLLTFSTRFSIAFRLAGKNSAALP